MGARCGRFGGSPPAGPRFPIAPLPPLIAPLPPTGVELELEEVLLATEAQGRVALGGEREGVGLADNGQVADLQALSRPLGVASAVGEVAKATVVSGGVGRAPAKAIDGGEDQPPASASNSENTPAATLMRARRSSERMCQCHVPIG